MDQKEKFAQWIEQLPPEARKSFSEAMIKAFTYEPKIAVFGKTGVGKSSLTNALFGQKACAISDVEACTREPKEVFMKLEGAAKGIKLLDVPGIGESSERDDEYFKLYAEILKEADMVLWVLKGDDRTFTADEAFYKTCMKPYIEKGKPFVVAVNQVDKIEPYREWDIENRKPGPTQEGNISKKILYVAKQFGDLTVSHVIPVSANEGYNLDSLVLKLIDGLPADKRYQTIHNMDQRIQEYETVKQEKSASFAEAINTIIDFLPIPAPLKAVGKGIVAVGSAIMEGVGEVIGGFVSGIGDFIGGLFGW